MYQSKIVLPMKAQLTDCGFKDITNPEFIEENIKNHSTSLFVINSVCGCSASSVRPGVLMSLNNIKIPKNLATVFAGYDIESTKKLREFLVPYPPSSPSIVFFNQGKLVHILGRNDIEGQSPEFLTCFCVLDFNFLSRSFDTTKYGLSVWQGVVNVYDDEENIE